MNDPIKKLTDVIAKALTKFREGDYDGVQDVLKSKAYTEAMRGLPDDNTIKKTTIGLYHHLETATLPYVHGRLDDKTLDAIHTNIESTLQILHSEDSLDNRQQKLFSILRSFGKLDKALHGFVEHVSTTRLDQAQALTKHEQALFDKIGAVEYWKDLVARRWGGDHHAGVVVPIEKEVPKITSALGDMFARLDDDMPSPALPPTTNTVQVTLEGKALEEFGGVTILNTPLKKAGAIAASVAGVGLVGHGIYNVYHAFVPPNTDQPVEIAEFGHAPTKEGVNWLRMIVGVGEIGVGTATLHRQLSGRWGVDAIKGQAEALCTHGTGRG